MLSKGVRPPLCEHQPAQFAHLGFGSLWRDAPMPLWLVYPDRSGLPWLDLLARLDLWRDAPMPLSSCPAKLFSFGGLAIEALMAAFAFQKCGASCPYHFWSSLSEQPSEHS